MRIIALIEIKGARLELRRGRPRALPVATPGAVFATLLLILIGFFGGLASFAVRLFSSFASSASFAAKL
jgi:hypothetical protein